MTMAGDYLTRPVLGTDDTQRMGARVARNAANMAFMINDLLVSAS
jgi:hypothetical protein